MKKTYCVSYSYTVCTDTEIVAENEKEARKKFKDALPYEKIDEVWEVRK